MSYMTISNPVIWADVPDPSVIRVGNVFYMVSTSMHSMPGCPIMRSENLQDWEIVNYVFDFLEDNVEHNLLHGNNIYGQGSWAASLRFHDDTFYVCFSSNDTNQFYVYRTKDIENGNWERSVIQGLYHDPSMLFDEGSIFVIYGNGDIRITELTEDATALKKDGINQLLFETEREGISLRCEGCHAYKLNGYYYLFFIEWPKIGNGRRRQLCYRSKDLLGPYEHRIVLDDDLGYHNKGVAQGGIVDTIAGEWYAFLFQDHDAVGRVPCVVPVTWSDDWPVFGIDGIVPAKFKARLPKSETKPLVRNDEFNCSENKLSLNWQWNHNPDHELWSLTERPGFLRLKTGSLTHSVEFARNTLTQRTEGPACSGMTLMEVHNMKPGDKAGLVALQHDFGLVGIQVLDTGERYISMCVKGNDGNEETVESIRFEGHQIYLKIDFNFCDSNDLATFHYSDDGLKWCQIGPPLQLKYTLNHFMGCRIGLFNYATKESSGFVDFDHFNYLKKI
ncbi:glycoside hydrolase family 43 protein [Halalkalibacter akibai]|uniref:Beta-xylosidase n=1 Tax=Halalkalibacter akibai (strain ATCC 43226 / DSM 21942 / CIP 109018 / JCM 9157 / 1139) TaxID=1236973 RepID=W4QWU2_HALA3|nr:glycoside hydrolase 43 family protein [Halalkalibacter akibai]GAE36113.1 beta-xylosidase [Halalkalibacter akibai JCM 9157]